jgi:hypothetical protein
MGWLSARGLGGLLVAALGFGTAVQGEPATVLTPGEPVTGSVGAQSYAYFEVPWESNNKDLTVAVSRLPGVCLRNTPCQDRLLRYAACHKQDIAFGISCCNVTRCIKQDMAFGIS